GGTGSGAGSAERKGVRGFLKFLTRRRDATDSEAQPAQAASSAEAPSKQRRGQSEPRTQELLAMQGEIVQRVRRLMDALAQETRRRQGAEQQADELDRHRTELEAELTQNKEAQAQLQQELETSRQKLQEQKESSSAEQNKLEARINEFQAAK